MNISLLRNASERFNADLIYIDKQSFVSLLNGEPVIRLDRGKVIKVINSHLWSFIAEINI
jgi:hypothetical protein